MAPRTERLRGDRQFVETTTPPAIIESRGCRLVRTNIEQVLDGFLDFLPIRREQRVARCSDTAPDNHALCVTTRERPCWTLVFMGPASRRAFMSRCPGVLVARCLVAIRVENRCCVASQHQLAVALARMSA